MGFWRLVDNASTHPCSLQRAGCAWVVTSYIYAWLSLPFVLNILYSQMSAKESWIHHCQQNCSAQIGASYSPPTKLQVKGFGQGLHES